MNLPSSLSACVSAPVIVADSILDEAALHLPFLGYAVKRDKDSLDLRRGGTLAWRLRDLSGGVHLSRKYRASEAGRRERETLMDLANAMNAEALTLRFYVAGDGDLVVESWYPNLYERSSFGRFMTALDLELHDRLLPRREQAYRLLE